MASAATETTSPELVFENVEDGETIYQVSVSRVTSRRLLTSFPQRCLIIKARFSPAADAPAFVTVEQSGEPFDALYPPQTWPVEDGNTKMIVMLSGGSNILSIHPNSDATKAYKLRLQYAPDTRLPPLHLAVMFGRDSELTMDFEPNRSRFDDPSSIASALARFRMAAYMWQAMIAEQMRQQGLGRRSFRLDEHWDVDTTSARFKHASREDEAFEAGATRNTARIHLVRSEHTVEEIRDARLAQDNPHGSKSNRLYTWFLDALHYSGISLFSWSAKPIVAGLIIDATWSQEDLFALGHAALGHHDPMGVSLCTMGSHLMYAWPEHLEDIQRCLTDVTRPEEGIVATGRDEVGTKWEVCCIGETEFLHQLAHAFGAGHTSGIVKGEGASHWPRHFVSRTAPSTQTGEVGIVVDRDTTNEAVFDIKDLLTFKSLPHFWMEGDEKITTDPIATREAVPSISFAFSASEDGTIAATKLISASPAKIVRVLWNGEPGAVGPSIAQPISGVVVPISDIEAEYSPDEPLHIAFLGGNGNERVVTNLWDLIQDPATLPIPGSEVVLQRRSVKCGDLERGLGGLGRMTFWSWATLLSKPMEHGTIARANVINLCIGDSLLGLYVRFQDGVRVNCGPRREITADGRYEKHFAGDRVDCMIPPSQEVVRVDVSRDADAILGLEFHLSNGDVKGSLSVGIREPEQVYVLGMFPNTLSLGSESASNWLTIFFDTEPPSGERIVGFYGRNYFDKELDGVVEFGIITAPSDVELPAKVYRMPQLQNTDGGLTVSTAHRPGQPTRLREPSSNLAGI